MNDNEINENDDDNEEQQNKQAVTNTGANTTIHHNSPTIKCVRGKEYDTIGLHTPIGHRAHPVPVGTTSIGNLYLQKKYNIWDQVCKYYFGPYPLKTRRDIYLKNSSTNCKLCVDKDCEWTVFGDKIIDIVVFKLQRKYNKQDETLHMLEPNYFIRLLIEAYQFMSDERHIPKCCWNNYYCLFPDKQVKLHGSGMVPKINEYYCDKELPWAAEERLFSKL